MDKKKFIIIVVVFSIIGALMGESFFIYRKFFKKEDAIKIVAATEKRYFEINDEAIGVQFYASKNFDRMSSQELQLKNPSFLYGFNARSDKNIYCTVSQTVREKPGIVKVSDLRDGVLSQIKKTYSDAKLESAEIVDVGENNNKGIKVGVGYTDNGIAMIQQEVVGITNKTATFMFCVAPRSVINLYKDDFDLFLNSIKIHPI